jgi:hypothetical protein
MTTKSTLIASTTDTTSTTTPHYYDNFLSSSGLTLLTSEATLFWEHYGGSKASAKSFWFDADSSDATPGATPSPPRCALEQFVNSVINFHKPNLPGVLGGEFWVQSRTISSSSAAAAAAAGAGLSFHFDKDENAFLEYDIMSHPDISTATYLTKAGSPLVIFDTQGHNDDDVSSSTVVYPRPKRHCAFPGSYLHGIPSELQPSDQLGEIRISVLVNLWTDHVPEGVEPMGRAMIRKIKGALLPRNEGTVVNQAAERCDAKVIKTVNVPSNSNITLSEHVEGDTGVLPRDEIHKAERSDGVVKFLYVDDDKKIIAKVENSKANKKRRKA